MRTEPKISVECCDVRLCVRGTMHLNSAIVHATAREVQDQLPFESTTCVRGCKLADANDSAHHCACVRMHTTAHVPVQR